MRLRPRRAPRKRLPPAPFINVVEDSPPLGERIHLWAEAIAFWVVGLALLVAALAIALILQATWLPVTAGVVAIAILLVIVLSYWFWPFGWPFG
jgi:hypothetical protein